MRRLLAIGGGGALAVVIVGACSAFSGSDATSPVTPGDAGDGGSVADGSVQVVDAADAGDASTGDAEAGTQRYADGGCPVAVSAAYTCASDQEIRCADNGKCQTAVCSPFLWCNTSRDCATRQGGHTCFATLNGIAPGPSLSCPGLVATLDSMACAYTFMPPNDAGVVCESDTDCDSGQHCVAVAVAASGMLPAFTTSICM